VAEFSRELLILKLSFTSLPTRNALRGIAAAPGRPISRIPLLSSAERHHLLVESTKPARLIRGLSESMNCLRPKCDAHRTPRLRPGAGARLAIEN
jgi:hypothetical protein